MQPDLLLAIPFGILAIPAFVLLAECVASLFGGRPSSTSLLPFRGRLAVLVPAHNEGRGVLPALESIAPAIEAGDRLLVVADNCTDDTASQARLAGATVIERHDPVLRGKGYALDFGFGHLAGDPPDVVIVIDADCLVAEGSLRSLAARCLERNRPQQARDLMVAPPGHEARLAVREFAWYLKNHVRPQGLAALGMPCQLLGTGMALPWRLIPGISVASSALAEDLKLGVELAIAGHSAEYFPETLVVSSFPVSDEAEAKQQRRWEQGTWRVMLTKLPALLSGAAVRRRPALLALALDLCVPPLVSYVAMLGAGFLLGAALLILAGLVAPLAIVALAISSAAAALAIGYRLYGRTASPAGILRQLGKHFLLKLRIYGKMRGWSGQPWERTDRD